jgi:hypothetical protein
VSEAKTGYTVELDDLELRIEQMEHKAEELEA